MALGLTTSAPVLTVAGTTSMLDPGVAEQLLPVLKAVAASASARHAAIVTGGTDAGVFHLLRLALESAPRRPDHVIGVAPDGLVMPTGSAVALGSKRAPIDPSLSVLVRVEGDQWGDETAVLSGVVAEIAGPEPAAMLLVGGGDVTRAELVEHLRRGRSIVVVDGTGRLADLVASGTFADDDGDLRALVLAGDVQVVRLSSGPNAVATAVTRALSRSRRSRGLPSGPATWWRTRRQRWVALSVFPRWPYRPSPPGPLVDPAAATRFPLLADRLARANELVYPAFAECDATAGVEQNRYRWFAVLAIFGGLLTTVFGAMQAWLQSAQWPGVVVATLGAATTALSTVARRQGSREQYLRARLVAERLRSTYFQSIANAASDGSADNGRRDLTLQVARIRYGKEPG
jgi:hypothetical protein